MVKSPKRNIAPCWSYYQKGTMMKKAVKPIALVILDGVGYNKNKQYNAVYQAKTPYIDSFINLYPNTLLSASGKAVGLLDGDIGNSEVGHLTLGAGRIIQQPVSIIHSAIKKKNFFKNTVLRSSLEKLRQSGGRLHIMGLLSDASVHSHIKHLKAFLIAAKQAGIQHIFIHPFLDGRDTPPKSAEQYLKKLELMIKSVEIGTISTIHGRFYAMDRDNNWERTEKTYKTLTEKQTVRFQNWQEELDINYAQNITDEFVEPTQLNHDGIIKDLDGIVFLNFRPDRARQLTQAFVDPNFNSFPTKKINLTCFITPTSYSEKLNTDVLFPKKTVKNSLPDVLLNNGKTVFEIAETEKYAHVTYFFSGGREKKLPNETRILIKSISAKNYIDHPKMSAEKITNAVLHSLKTDPHNFYIINYANADMVGHSGDINATIKAVECLDNEIQKLYKIIVEQMDGTIFLTADHGNAEVMFDKTTGQPQTAHTTNPVEFIFITQKKKGSHEKLPLKKLSDVAPFILQYMKINIPDEMC